MTHHPDIPPHALTEWITAHAALGIHQLADIGQHAHDLADRIEATGGPIAHLEARALRAQRDLVAEIALQLVAHDLVTELEQDLGGQP